MVIKVVTLKENWKWKEIEFYQCWWRGRLPQHWLWYMSKRLLFCFLL